MVAATSARRLLLATIALTMLLTLRTVAAYNPNLHFYGGGQRIAMDSIRTLTFYSDKRTAYRRTKPLPQLTCVGSMCSRYQPDVVQCQAMGDGQWKCSADLPSTMRMGRVEVSCEGYDYAEDPYVLKNSCALTYHLLPSGIGPDDPWRNYRGKRGGWADKLVEALFQVVFWGILATIVYGFIKAVRGNGQGAGAAGRGAGGGSGGGRGGGGGGGGWWPGGSFPPYNNPPPPYTPKPEPDSSGSSSSSSWRPGFWTGLGLGGLAASAAASARRRQHGSYFPPPAQPGYLYDSDYGYGFGAGGPAFGRPATTLGRGGRGTRWDDDDRGIGSSGWRESTGFGGTRNR